VSEAALSCIDMDRYFCILDRSKEMVVTGGEDVYSDEVEAVIYSRPQFARLRYSEFRFPMGRISGCLRNFEAGDALG
jgi:acyl-CoA synthetase (AMP-forming)/AMP-acid ligase II